MNARRPGSLRAAAKRAIAVGTTVATLALAGTTLAQTGSQSVEDLYRAGRRALAARDLPTAERMFARVLDRDPNHTGALLNYGICRSTVGDGEAAERAYRRILAQEPGHPRANNNLGNVYFRRGDYDRAASFYRAAVDGDEDYLLAWFHLGWIARHRGELEDSERSFRRCLALEPSTPQERVQQVDARYYVGAIRFRERDWAETIRWMTRVLEDRPNHTEAHYYLGQALARTGRREEATRHLRTHRELVAQQATDGPVASGGQ